MSTSAPDQLGFDHEAHAKANVRCAECHRGIETETWAGLPTVQDCLACHALGEARHPDVSRLRAMAREGISVRWQRLYALAPHAWFSHRAHAKAEIGCPTCHGSAGEAATLVREDDREGEALMNWCLDCHREKDAATDCLTCHL